MRQQVKLTSSLDCLEATAAVVEGSRPQNPVVSPGASAAGIWSTAPLRGQRSMKGNAIQGGAHVRRDSPASLEQRSERSASGSRASALSFSSRAKRTAAMCRRESMIPRGVVARALTGGPPEREGGVQELAGGPP